jgi:hypothetical protein
MGRIHHPLDIRTGIVRITGEGLCSLSQVTDHFARLRETIGRIRSERGSVKVLIDTSQSAVQAGDVEEKIERATEGLPTDRVALIVASMLHNMQMRRLTQTSPIEPFVSEQAALTWLQAWDRPIAC